MYTPHSRVTETREFSKEVLPLLNQDSLIHVIAAAAAVWIIQYVPQLAVLLYEASQKF
jgi:hypothetical protein